VMPFKIRATRPFRILDQEVRYLRVDLSECLNPPLQVSVPKSLLSIVVRRKAGEAARGFANVEWFRRIGIGCCAVSTCDKWSYIPRNSKIKQISVYSNKH
jgi:hypothetical protein